MAWQFGMYVMSAVSTAIDMNLRGTKAKRKYISKPFLDEIEGKEDKHSRGEHNEELAVYEMKIRTKMLLDMGLPESPM